LQTHFSQIFNIINSNEIENLKNIKLFNKELEKKIVDIFKERKRINNQILLDFFNSELTSYNSRIIKQILKNPTNIITFLDLISIIKKYNPNLGEIFKSLTKKLLEFKNNMDDANGELK